MSKNSQPHEIAYHFYQSLMQGQFSACWQLFSDKSQKEFIRWTLSDIYQQNEQAAKTAKLGAPEVKLMFETNNLDLLLRFWQRFNRQTRAADFARYAYFDTTERQGKQAVVEARLLYDNGQEQRIPIRVLFERGGWRLGYVESGITL